MKLIRNFFYAVGAVILLYMYSANPATATFADLVRLVQSETARNVALILTIILWALDIASGFGEGACLSISVPRSDKAPAEHAGSRAPQDPAVEKA